MPNKVVSIIIPVFNAETSLANCIGSILNQTYKQLEIIMVNDGSTDKSGEICEHYAISDQRIKVVHQENCGPSSARNTGIEKATGDYIQFVDADDYMKPKMTETLLQAMTNQVGLVICGYEAIYTHTNITRRRDYIPSISGFYMHDDFIKHFGELYRCTLIPSPCNKLYDANLIRGEHIRFMETMKYGEDLFFNLEYFKTSPNVYVIQDQLYNYLITGNHSLSRTFNERLSEHQEMLHQGVEAFLLEKGAYAGENRHHMKVIYARHVVNALDNLFHLNSTYTPKEKKQQIAKIISNAALNRDVDHFKDDLQTIIVGQMIKYHLKRGIYYLFTFKKIMQYRLQPLFHMLRRGMNMDVSYHK